MLCTLCHTENREGRRFCSKCAAPLAVVCPTCGFTNDPGDDFCGGCAQSLRAGTQMPPKFQSPDVYTPKHLAERILTSKAALEGERKQVTVLFADLKGSMELLADRDPEEARKILDAVLERMMDAVHRFEGTVNQVMGDGIMALFGAPVAHEDHAVRACYAALRMQESVKEYAKEARHAHGASVQIRVGLNSGDVIVRAVGSDLRMDYTAVGQTTHLAARMEQLADPGTIVVTPATLALVEGRVEVVSLGPVVIKGLTEPLEVFEVTGVGVAHTRLHAAARRGLTRFVGRDHELEQLWRVQEQAGRGRGQVVVLVGEAGVGKSRLVYEFTHSYRLQGWLILEAASVSYGKATSYLPVIALLKSYFKIQDRDDHREMREKVTGKLLALDRTLEPTLAALLSLVDVPVQDASWEKMAPTQRRQQMLDGVKRLLLREAREQPLAVIFEDLDRGGVGVRRRVLQGPLSVQRRDHPLAGGRLDAAVRRSRRDRRRRRGAEDLRRAPALPGAAPADVSTLLGGRGDHPLHRQVEHRALDPGGAPAGLPAPVPRLPGRGGGERAQARSGRERGRLPRGALRPQRGRGVGVATRHQLRRLPELLRRFRVLGSLPHAGGRGEVSARSVHTSATGGMDGRADAASQIRTSGDAGRHQAGGRCAAKDRRQGRPRVVRLVFRPGVHVLGRGGAA